MEHLLPDMSGGSYHSSEFHTSHVFSNTSRLETSNWDTSVRPYWVMKECTEQEPHLNPFTN